MKSILDTLLRIIGILFSIIVPYRRRYIYVSIRRRIYTGYVSSCFQHIGKFSLVDVDTQIVGGVSIGDNSCIDRHCSITSVTYENRQGKITIGNHVSIGPYAHITSLESITIGNNIDIGPHCLISDNSKKATLNTVHINPRKRPLTTKGPIKIGDCTWIGENVCIMSGVTIGVGCVIGANSVVTHNIPDYSVAAGIPAKIISKIE